MSFRFQQIGFCGSFFGRFNVFRYGGFIISFLFAVPVRVLFFRPTLLIPPVMVGPTFFLFKFLPLRRMDLFGRDSRNGPKVTPFLSPPWPFFSSFFFSDSPLSFAPPFAPWTRFHMLFPKFNFVCTPSTFVSSYEIKEFPLTARPIEDASSPSALFDVL